jgi:hypothetical protein
MNAAEAIESQLRAASDASLTALCHTPLQEIPCCFGVKGSHKLRHKRRREDLRPAGEAVLAACNAFGPDAVGKHVRRLATRILIERQGYS